MALPAALMLACVVSLVNPIGNFPLNDDWVYANQVHEVLEGHRYRGGPLAMALTHSLWGAAFAGVFGESHTVLRLSTLVLAFVTLWATARCALEAGLPRWGAIISAAVVLANPIFLNLSYTFMTEIPFMAAFTLAGWHYLRFLNDGRRADLALGGVFGVLATLSRQFGVIVGIAAAGTWLLLGISRRRRLDLPAVALFLAPWAAGAALLLLVPGLDGRPSALQDPRRLTAAIVLLRTVHYSGAALVYAGLFLLPATIARLATLAVRPRSWTGAQWIALPLWMGLIYGYSIQWTASGARLPVLPLLGNVLRDAGTGPLTLHDTYDLGLPAPFQLGPAWWAALTAFSFVSIGVFLSDALVPLARRLFDGPRRRAPADGDAAGPDRFAAEIFLLAWSFGVLLAPYHLVVFGPFDRYLLPAAPPLAILALRSLRLAQFRPTAPLLGLLCLAAALPGIAAVQDYLAWNRARWQALGYLQAEMKVPSRAIDGGYEFNGISARAGAADQPDQAAGTPSPGRAYAVTFSPLPGYRVLRQFPYYSWLGRTERTLLALGRR